MNEHAGARALLQTMFEQMVVAKDAEACARFYHPDFVLTSNGITQDYAEMDAGHRRVYATAISYAVEYDDDAWVEAPDRVAGRMWITTARPDETAVRIEVVLVASVRDGLLHRVWELTWPDWSALPALESY